MSKTLFYIQGQETIEQWEGKKTTQKTAYPQGRYENRQASPILLAKTGIVFIRRKPEKFHLSAKERVKKISAILSAE